MKKIYILIIFFFSSTYVFADVKIVYIDINSILNNSIVGQSISKHILTIKEAKNKEFATIESQLLDKEKDVIKKKNIVKKEDFEKQVNALKKEVENYNIKKINFGKEIDEKKIKYTKIVLDALNPIIADYVEKNSISMVLPKKNIIIAKKNLDITSVIMDLLNIQLKTIDF